MEFAYTQRLKKRITKPRTLTGLLIGLNRSSLFFLLILVLQKIHFSNSLKSLPDLLKKSNQNIPLTSEYSASQLWNINY